jgi:hypothetical protein
LKEKRGRFKLEDSSAEILKNDIAAKETGVQI